MARRKPKVVWLPVDRNNRLGEAGSVSSSTASAHGIVQVNIVGPIGSPNTVVVPVVLDQGPELALTSTTVTLADIAQSAYRLRRIVGKVFACINQDATDGTPGDAPVNMLATVGFIVLRTNEEDSLPLQNAAQYDAASFGNITDPWIWRRTWLLTNLLEQAQLPNGDPGKQFQGYGSSAQAGGGVADGPHIDAKTARVIGPEERLCMVATGVALDGNDPQLGITLTVITDLRVLASMRSSSGNRRNASR